MSRRDRNGLTAELEAALREVSGLGVLYSNAAAERLGLHPTDMECLGYLADGPLSAGALAEATRLTTGAITGVIDRLERAGFARREPEPNDRRKVLVRATPQAAARTAPVFAPIAQASAGVLAGYSDAELALLLHFLKKSRAAALAALAEVRQGGAERPPAERKG